MWAEGRRRSRARLPPASRLRCTRAHGRAEVSALAIANDYSVISGDVSGQLTLFDPFEILAREEEELELELEQRRQRQRDQRREEATATASRGETHLCALPRRIEGIHIQQSSLTASSAVAWTSSSVHLMDLKRGALTTPQRWTSKSLQDVAVDVSLRRALMISEDSLSIWDVRTPETCSDISTTGGSTGCFIDEQAIAIADSSRASIHVYDLRSAKYRLSSFSCAWLGSEPVEQLVSDGIYIYASSPSTTVQHDICNEVDTRCYRRTHRGKYSNTRPVWRWRDKTFLSASEDGNVEMFDIFPMEASCRSRHRLKPTSTTKLSHLTITALAINTQETLLAFAEGTDAVLLSGLPMEMPVA
eukprot:m.84399 g.84399  ORF g.84399 m.84399 type:complete len:360 (+) comp14387_c0_seq2:82-1161(+)